MKKICKWEIFEESFTIEEDFLNPFLEVEIKAIFQMNDTKFIIDGFYDGTEQHKHIWRIRFAPMLEGQWTFQTYANISSLNGKTGCFECTAPISRGPLTINPDFPNWFSRGDGKAQIILNDGWFPHIPCQKCYAFEESDFPPPSEHDFKKYIDILAENKVNMVLGMSQLFARQSKIVDKSFIWPWKIVDCEKNQIDKTQFNLTYFHRWEHILEYAKEHNLFYAYEILYDNSIVRPLEWDHHPYNIKNGGWLEDDSNGKIGWHNLFDVNNKHSLLYLGRYIRYCIARLSCYWNICWEIGSENANLAVLPDDILPNAQLSIKKIAQWFKYWVQYIQQYDPYHRLRTLGDTSHHPLLVCENGNDFILTQDPRNYPSNEPLDHYKALKKEGIFYWKYSRPMLFGEMDSANNGNYHHERRMYWIAMTSGFMMSRPDRHFRFIKNNMLAEAIQFNIREVPPIYKYLKIMRTFLEQKVSFWKMHPISKDIKSNPLVCGLVSEYEYLLYFPFGGSAEIDLPESNGEWFNPRIGKIEKNEYYSGGVTQLKAPNTDDWVLHIKVPLHICTNDL